MTKLQRAAKHIGAVGIGRGQWAHYADETSRYYVVSGDDLRELCDYLDSDDRQIREDAYSHWCAGTDAREMPEGWEPGDRIAEAADVHEHGWQWRPTATDTAFAPPFGTIRQCRCCGCLVAGGPTACVRCAKAGE